MPWMVNTILDLSATIYENIMTKISVTGNHLYFQRTFLCKTLAVGLQINKWKIWIRYNQSVKQMLQRRRLIINDHLPKLTTENSVLSIFTPKQLKV